jgi:threonine dehydrogenase-like Zn-dependent dehydrogenase
MKQLWFVAENLVELREVEVQEPGPRQVKVKIVYAALCATDVHQVTMGVLGARPPMALGHEASGIIEELGSETEQSGFAVGDKVCLFPVTSCGVCPNCKKGRPQYCSHSKTTGAFANYVTTDMSAVFKLPYDADLKHYCLAEPVNCTVRAMELAPIPHGATVAVSGIGGIGAILLDQVILSGATEITAIDPVPGKRQLAVAMGAQYALDPFDKHFMQRALNITNGEGFDFVFEMSGSPKAALTPLKLLARCGNAVYFAVFPPTFEMPLNLYELYMKEGRIQTVFTTPSLMPRTIRIIPRLRLDLIIGKVMPLEQATEAFDLFHESVYPKILLDCN